MTKYANETYSRNVKAQKVLNHFEIQSNPISLKDKS